MSQLALDCNDILVQFSIGPVQKNRVGPSFQLRVVNTHTFLEDGGGWRVL